MITKFESLGQQGRAFVALIINTITYCIFKEKYFFSSFSSSFLHVIFPLLYFSLIVSLNCRVSTASLPTGSEINPTHSWFLILADGSLGQSSGAEKRCAVITQAGESPDVAEVIPWLRRSQPGSEQPQISAERRMQQNET